MAQFDQSLLDAFHRAAKVAIDEVEALRQRLLANVSPLAQKKTPEDEAVHNVAGALQALDFIGFGDFNIVSAQLEAYADLRMPPTDRKLPDDLKCAKLVAKLKEEVDRFAAAQAKPAP